MSQTTLENEQTVIEEVFDIESAMLKIKQAEDRIAYYKALKSKRVKPIDEQIKEDQAIVASMRQSILEKMQEENQKNLKFPGIGSASVQNRKGTWAINDELKLRDKLEIDGLFDDCGEVIIKFNKTKLNKVLSEYEKNNNIPDSVEREEGSSSLTLRYEDSSDNFLDMFDADMFVLPQHRNVDVDSHPQGLSPSDGKVDMNQLDGVDF